MPSSFLAPLQAPAHTASSTAKASDKMARQAKDPDFGQALARSLSAQHNARREQATVEAKSADAKRLDAKRMDAQRADAHQAQANRAPQAEPSTGQKKTSGSERTSQRDKTHQSEARENIEELSGKDPSSAALGVLDWLGAQAKAQALGRGSESPQVQTGLSPLADKAARVGTEDVLTLAKPGQDETDLRGPSTPRAPLQSVEAGQADATALAQVGDAASRAASATASLTPDLAVPPGMEGAQNLASHDLNKQASLQGLEASQGLPTAAAAQAAPKAGDAAGGAALGSDPRRVSAARTGLRAAPAAAAPAGLASLSQPAPGKAVAFPSATSAIASTTASTPAGAQAGSAGTDNSVHASDGRSATAYKAAVMGSLPGTGEGVVSPAMEAPAGPQAAGDQLTTPGNAQALGHWGQIEPEVGTPAWHQALSQQVMQMRQGNANEAELQLNPLGLGPLHIKLSLRDQALNAEFTAAHAEVRAALEAALPQLREALQQGGVQLGQAWVESSDAQTANSRTGSHTAGRESHQSERPGPSAQANSAATRVASLAESAGRSDVAGVRHGPGQRLNTFA